MWSPKRIRGVTKTEVLDNTCNRHATNSGRTNTPRRGAWATNTGALSLDEAVMAGIVAAAPATASVTDIITWSRNVASEEELAIMQSGDCSVFKHKENKGDDSEWSEIAESGDSVLYESYDSEEDGLEEWAEGRNVGTTQSEASDERYAAALAETTGDMSQHDILAMLQRTAVKKLGASMDQNISGKDGEAMGQDPVPSTSKDARYSVNEAMSRDPASIGNHEATNQVDSCVAEEKIRDLALTENGATGHHASFADGEAQSQAGASKDKIQNKDSTDNGAMNQDSSSMDKNVNSSQVAAQTGENGEAPRCENEAKSVTSLDDKEASANEKASGTVKIEEIKHTHINTGSIETIEANGAIIGEKVAYSCVSTDMEISTSPVLKQNRSENGGLNEELEDICSVASGETTNMVGALVKENTQKQSLVGESIVTSSADTQESAEIALSDMSNNVALQVTASNTNQTVTQCVTTTNNQEQPESSTSEANLSNVNKEIANEVRPGSKKGKCMGKKGKCKRTCPCQAAQKQRLNQAADGGQDGFDKVTVGDQQEDSKIKSDHPAPQVPKGDEKSSLLLGLLMKAIVNKEERVASAQEQIALRSREILKIEKDQTEQMEIDPRVILECKKEDLTQEEIAAICQAPKKECHGQGGSAKVVTHLEKGICTGKCGQTCYCQVVPKTMPALYPMQHKPKRYKNDGNSAIKKHSMGCRGKGGKSMEDEEEDLYATHQISCFYNEIDKEYSQFDEMLEDYEMILGTRMSLMDFTQTVDQGKSDDVKSNSELDGSASESTSNLEAEDSESLYVDDGQEPSCSYAPEKSKAGNSNGTRSSPGQKACPASKRRKVESCLGQATRNESGIQMRCPDCEFDCENPESFREWNKIIELFVAKVLWNKWNDDKIEEDDSESEKGKTNKDKIKKCIQFKDKIEIDFMEMERLSKRKITRYLQDFYYDCKLLRPVVEINIKRNRSIYHKPDLVYDSHNRPADTDDIVAVFKDAVSFEENLEDDGLIHLVIVPLNSTGCAYWSRLEDVGSFILIVEVRGLEIEKHNDINVTGTIDDFVNNSDIGGCMNVNDIVYSLKVYNFAEPPTVKYSLPSVFPFYNTARLVGNTIVIGGMNGEVQMVHLDQAGLERKLLNRLESPLTNVVTHIIPCEEKVLTYSRRDGMAVIWNTVNGRVVAKPKIEAGVQDLDYNGDFLAWYKETETEKYIFVEIVASDLEKQVPGKKIKLDKSCYFEFLHLSRLKKEVVLFQKSCDCGILVFSFTDDVVSRVWLTGMSSGGYFLRNRKCTDDNTYVVIMNGPDRNYYLRRYCEDKSVWLPDTENLGLDLETNKLTYCAVHGKHLFLVFDNKFIFLHSFTSDRMVKANQQAAREEPLLDCLEPTFLQVEGNDPPHPFELQWQENWYLTVIPFNTLLVIHIKDKDTQRSIHVWVLHY